MQIIKTFRPSILKIPVYIFLFLMMLSGCSFDGSGPVTVIKGSFPDFAGSQVVLSEIDINMAVPLDTAQIKPNGSFKFKLKRNEPGFYLIKIDNKNYLTLVLDQEKKVRITAEGTDLRKNYRVEGSPDSELFRQFDQFLEVNKAKVDSLSKRFNDNQRSPAFQTMKMEMDESYQEIFDQQRGYVIRFLDNHCQSLASLLVINRRFGQRKVLTESDDLDYFLRIDSCLALKYPQNKHLADHQKRMERFIEKRKMFELADKKLAPGNKAPDLSLETPAGKTINLHSLQGQPVIVYFWASWDEHSRKSNKILKDILNSLGNHQVKVYAIGLESYREVWLNAIQNDGTGQWTHVTDYLNIHSGTRSLFNIPEQLPFFYLLDKDLTIIDRGNDVNKLSASLSLIQH